MVIYTIASHRGIYEIGRWDDQTKEYVTVQTNIRTHEKAVQARQDWQQRERERGDGRATV